MQSYSIAQDFDPTSGFCHRRKRPKLRPGFTWEKQIAKYCPHNLITNHLARGRKDSGFLAFVTGRKEHGYVFCHRGHYDRAKKIPENSVRAINNGLKRGLSLHEVDVRFGENPRDGFLAHDRSSRRVTSKDGNWSAYNLSEVLAMCHVARRYSFGRQNFANSYQELEDKISSLKQLLIAGSVFTTTYYFPPRTPAGQIGIPQPLVRTKWVDNDAHIDGRTLQLDLRGSDLPQAIVFFKHLLPKPEFGPGTMVRAELSNSILLKGYNSEYPYQWELEAALEQICTSQGRTPMDLNDNKLPIIMVFYREPVIARLLRYRGLDIETASLEQRQDMRDYEVTKEVKEQINSFLFHKRKGIQLIPEIVHSGLGLRYDPVEDTAVDPYNGEPIVDPEVLLESRFDYGMIQASLETKRSHPELFFSSCTRLYDVRTSDGMELNANMMGNLDKIPVGEKGLGARLRRIHGGLYPQSDLVVADDPLAEIAARTWIDEYAKLARVRLLRISYQEWLEQAGPEVVKAVNELNGPFMPNTFSIPVDENLDIQIGDLPDFETKASSDVDPDESDSSDFDSGESDSSGVTTSDLRSSHSDSSGVTLSDLGSSDVDPSESNSGDIDPPNLNARVTHSNQSKGMFTKFLEKLEAARSTSSST